MPLKEPWRERRRTSLPRRWVNKALLVLLRDLLRYRIGAQPQRDVGWLRRLSNHPHQIAAQGLQVCLISELGREGFNVFLVSYVLRK
jgi:hypothetical protein